MAPETMGDPFDGDPASADPFSADMWCLGTTVARALTNHAIFNSTLTLRQYQKNMIKFPIELLVEARLSSEGTVFVSSLMAANPLARPSAAEVIEHLWLTPASDSTHVIVGKDLGTVKGTQASEDWTMGEWTTTVPFESYAQDPFASFASATNKPRVQPHTIVTSREPRPRSPQAESSELPWATEYLELARFHPSFSGGANVPLNPVWEKFLNDGRDELNFDATRDAFPRPESHFATSSDFEEPEPIVDHETEALGKWTTTVSVHSDGHEPNSGPASTVLKSGYQPQTSNEAMMHFLRRVDAVEKASEAATVGLRSFINPDEVQNTSHMTISIEPNSTPRR
jgi:serine/threonine protein kinase